MKKNKISNKAINVRRVGPVAFKRKKKFKKNPTPAESIFLEILKKYKIPFQFQKVVFMSDMYYILDFVIPMKPRLIIEIDGKSHNNRLEYDKKREREVLSNHRNFNREKMKYKFLRIKNEQVFSGEADLIIKNLYRPESK